MVAGPNVPEMDTLGALLSSQTGESIDPHEAFQAWPSLASSAGSGLDPSGPGAQYVHRRLPRAFLAALRVRCRYIAVPKAGRVLP